MKFTDTGVTVESVDEAFGLSYTNVCMCWDEAVALAALDPSEPLRTSSEAAVSAVVATYPGTAAEVGRHGFEVLLWAKARQAEEDRA